MDANSTIAFAVAVLTIGVFVAMITDTYLTRRVFKSKLRRDWGGKRIVYVASPWRAETPEEAERNFEYAKAVSRSVIAHGAVPITPHLLYTRFLNDEDPEERRAGIEIGIALLKWCDELWVFTKYGISEGMKGEMDAALAEGMKVRVFTTGTEAV